MEVFLKSGLCEVLPNGKQLALGQLQYRPQQPGRGGNGPLPPFGAGSLNPVCAAVSNALMVTQTFGMMCYLLVWVWISSPSTRQI